MSRNGAGVYSLPAPPSPFVNGQTASATDMMTVLTDVAAALTASIAADGQTPMTGNLDLNGNNIIGVGTLKTTSTVTVGGTMSVAGSVTLTSSVTGTGTWTTDKSISAGTTLSAGTGLTVTAGGAKVTGNSTVTGTLTVSAATTLSSTLAVTGAVTAANGTAGTQVVNFGQFPATTGATGTETMPNGVIRKWGTGTTTLGTGSVTFAAAFPTACDNVQMTLNGGASKTTINPVIVGAVTAAGFAVWGDATQTLGFYWSAVGR